MNLKKKSIKILKSLQLKNGGILATPLNGAYPYVYTRDAVIITKALNKVGLVKNSEKFYYFMERFSKLRDYGEVFQRYTHNGYPSVTRRNENDNEGLLLHGIYDTYKHNKKEVFVENMWPTIEKTTKLIFKYSKSGLVKTQRSIHENAKYEKGYEIWANCTATRGLYDAAKMAKLLNHKKQQDLWNKKAQDLLKNIKKKLFNKKMDFFIKSPKFKLNPDISQLSPFYFNLIDSKKILKNTLNYLKKHLWNEELGGIRRFRKFEAVRDWHWYTGGSGSWCALTCMLAKFYKTIGSNKEYKNCTSWIKEVAKKSKGLLPEHIATKEEYFDWKRHEIEFNTRIINETKKAEKTIKKMGNREVIYWANPLGWSHAEYILLK